MPLDWERKRLLHRRVSSPWALAWYCCAVLMMLAGIARADQGEGGEFVAQPVDGARIAGRLAAIEPGWRVTLQADKSRTLNGLELIALRRQGHPPTFGPSGSQVLLANGDRIRAIAHRASQETIDLNSELLGDLSIPLERLTAVVLNPPADRVAREALCRRLAGSRRKQDLVVLANGDELAGSFLGLDDAAVRFDGGQGVVEIDRGGVQAVALSSDLIAFPKPAGLYAEILLADGSQLTLLDAELDGANLHGRTAFGGDAFIPVEQVSELDFRNGRSVYLSDLEPAEYRYTPYLSLHYGYQRDRSAQGNAILLRGELFRKGIGMHSRSELTYALEPRAYSRFEATVGVDDETAGRGSVVFRVLLDGKPVWESELLTGSSAIQPVRVELGDARRLTLVVDFGEQGHVQDHADWAAARLIR